MFTQVNAPQSSLLSAHLLPLMDVADESGETKQAEQAQNFGEADNP